MNGGLEERGRDEEDHEEVARSVTESENEPRRLLPGKLKVARTNRKQFSEQEEIDVGAETEINATGRTAGSSIRRGMSQDPISSTTRGPTAGTVRIVTARSAHSHTQKGLSHNMD